MKVDLASQNPWKNLGDPQGFVVPTLRTIVPGSGAILKTGWSLLPAAWALSSCQIRFGKGSVLSPCISVFYGYWYTINHHRHRGLNQHKSILQFWKSEAWNASHRANRKGWVRLCSFLESLEENLFSLPFPDSRGYLHSLAFAFLPSSKPVMASQVFLTSHTPRWHWLCLRLPHLKTLVTASGPPR